MFEAEKATYYYWSQYLGKMSDDASDYSKLMMIDRIQMMSHYLRRINS